MKGKGYLFSVRGKIVDNIIVNARRRLPVIMVKLRMAQAVKDAVKYIEQGHILKHSLVVRLCWINTLINLLSQVVQTWQITWETWLTMACLFDLVYKEAMQKISTI